jgi:hypothetical protein
VLAIGTPHVAPLPHLFLAEPEKLAGPGPRGAVDCRGLDWGQVHAYLVAVAPQTSRKTIGKCAIWAIFQGRGILNNNLGC